jgi:hypothetical protein
MRDEEPDESLMQSVSMVLTIQIARDRDRLGVTALAALEASTIKRFDVELDRSQRHPRLALRTAACLDGH